jgi:hypothetical protein
MANILQQEIKKAKIKHLLNVAWGRDIEYKLIAFTHLKNVDIDFYNKIYKEIQQDENNKHWWDYIMGKYMECI